MKEQEIFEILLDKSLIRRKNGGHGSI